MPAIDKRLTDAEIEELAQVFLNDETKLGPLRQWELRGGRFKGTKIQ
jgi:hypothetical protein